MSAWSPAGTPIKVAVAECACCGPAGCGRQTFEPSRRLCVGAACMAWRFVEGQALHHHTWNTTRLRSIRRRDLPDTWKELCAWLQAREPLEPAAQAGTWVQDGEPVSTADASAAELYESTPKWVEELRAREIAQGASADALDEAFAAAEKEQVWHRRYGELRGYCGLAGAPGPMLPPGGQTHADE